MFVDSTRGVNVYVGVHDTSYVTVYMSCQAAKKGDSSKAAKIRDKQAKAELEQAQMYAAEVEAAMNEDEDSSDGEYDEAAMEADARAAEYAALSDAMNHAAGMFDTITG